MGKARPDHEWTHTRSQSKLTTIQFGDEEKGQGDNASHVTVAELQDFVGKSSEIQETTRSQSEDEVV